MPKGKHTFNPKKMKRLRARAELTYVLGQQREAARRKEREKKRQEGRNDFKQTGPRHNPTTSNLERIRNAIQGRADGGAH